MTDPTTVLLHSDDALGQAAIDTFGTDLAKADGIAQVSPDTLSEDSRTAVYSALLDHDPTSDAAIADVKGPIRDAAHDAASDGAEAFVGGTTSVFVDMHEAMNRDYSVVFPVAALVIMIILALLLRSLVAPWFLMASVGLGFGATGRPVKAGARETRQTRPYAMRVPRSRLQVSSSPARSRR